MQERDTISVRRIQPGEYPVAARLHIDGLPGEFLSSLGTRFLSVLYEGINNDPGGFVLIAEQDGEILGFVSGATQSDRVSRAVLKAKWPQFAWWAGWHVLLHPHLIPSVLSALKPSEDEYASKPELLSIAVSKSAQGKGVGKLLIDAFNKQMREHGVDFYHLIVAEVNSSARGFYERCGFVPLGRVRMFGTWKCRLGLHLT